MTAAVESLGIHSPLAAPLQTIPVRKSPPVSIDEVEVEKWRHVRISPEYAELLRQLLEQEIAKRRSEAERDGNVAKRQIENLKEQRKKLLDAHYASAIPPDLLKTEQDRIATKLAAANGLLAASQTTFETIEATLQRCLTFLTNCHAAYRDAPQQVRRHMNQAVFERFLVGEDGSTKAELSGAFGILLAPDLVTHEAKSTERTEQSPLHRTDEWPSGMPSWLEELWEQVRTATAGRKEPRPASPAWV